MLDLARASAILKELYPDDVVKSLTYKDRPFFAMVAKDEKFVGELRKVPSKYGNPQNRSTNFSIASSQTSYSRFSAFKIERKKNYSFATVDNETLLATENDDGAFVSALETEMEGAFDSLANSLGQSVWGDGSYAIGRRSSVVGAVLTLTDENQIVNFEVGMQLEASDTLTGIPRPGYIEVTAVDREAGTFTFNGVIVGFVDTDYLFPRGDKANAISGVQAWVPVGATRAAALAASFWGVTRNVDATRLGGWYKDYSALPIEEALTKGMSLVGREGGNPDYIFLNPMKYNDLVNSLGSKVQYINETIAGVGFQGVVVYGHNGSAKVFSDRWVPYDYGAILTMNTWQLCSLGSAIRVFDTDGLRVLRSQTVDGVDIRLCSYANLECHAPGWNMMVKLS